MLIVSQTHAGLMAFLQACGVTFSQYRLLPMGSYPRVADAKGTYDLYGPVSMMNTGYSRAMVCVLACIKVNQQPCHVTCLLQYVQHLML